MGDPIVSCNSLAGSCLWVGKQVNWRSQSVHLKSILSQTSSKLACGLKSLSVRSKTFQRFAVRSNDMFQEMSKKGIAPPGFQDSLGLWTG